MPGKLSSLRKDKDIERVFRSGRSAFDKFLGIKCRKNEEKTSRLAIIISAKISKKAVIRNKIRRRLKEITRKRLEKSSVGYDLVLIALPPIVDKDFNELRDAVTDGFERLRII